jgi:hypothetical protein
MASGRPLDARDRIGTVHSVWTLAVFFEGFGTHTPQVITTHQRNSVLENYKKFR